MTNSDKNGDRVSGWSYDTPQYLRLDPLTGAGNQLAFFEWLLSVSDSKKVSPFTLISLDVHNLKQLNDFHGFAAGDAALRWAVLVLEEEAAAEVYRLGSDEFVGVLKDGTPEAHSELFERVCIRLQNEACLVKLDHPAAFVAMIHYTGLEAISPKDVLGVIYGNLIDLKHNPDQSHKIIDAAEGQPQSDLSGLINDLARRMVSLGVLLDNSYRLAHEDAMTGLPNMRAAMNELESSIEQAETTEMPFVILLIDGDNLRNYNKLGYLAGDEMIMRLGNTLENQMRPTDFLARWRTGDEFLAIIRQARLETALIVAERLRSAVKRESQAWVYPVTISLGMACYPEHGQTTDELLLQAENSLNLAKEAGKDQIGLLKD